MDIIDLHTHSKISDGSMTPKELIYHAKACGLKAIALTDHDTVAGLDQAKEAAKSVELELVSGVELAAWQDSTELHIVGLDIDHTQTEFQSAMLHMQQIREERNIKMIELMRAAGVDITLEKLHEAEGDGVLTRANFARYLLNVGFVKSLSEAFDRYLNAGKPFYLPRTTLSPENAICLIKKAGGIPILAHPMVYKIGKATLEKYVGILKDMGLEGIEVYYSTNTPSDERYSASLAHRFDLKFSGGSDFHGTYKPKISLGSGMCNLNIPYHVLSELRKNH